MQQKFKNPQWHVYVKVTENQLEVLPGTKAWTVWTAKEMGQYFCILTQTIQ